LKRWLVALTGPILALGLAPIPVFAQESVPAVAGTWRFAFTLAGHTEIDKLVFTDSNSSGKSGRVTGTGDSGPGSGTWSLRNPAQDKGLYVTFSTDVGCGVRIGAVGSWKPSKSRWGGTLDELQPNGDPCASGDWKMRAPSGGS
jgi:hypothetical protein